MSQFTILSVFFTLCSCAVGPTVVITSPNGTRTMINLQASIAEKTTDEAAQVTLADGTSLYYRKIGKDQTAVPLSGIRTWGTVTAAADVLNAGVRNTEILEKGANTRLATEAGVKKAKIAADVTKSTFVPPEP